MSKLLIRRSIDISFNELYEMYKVGELIIKPEFQRYFKWDDLQQSRFIESLTMDMPIPPIFVDEQEDGTFVLVDGLQRISTYLRFRGLKIDTSNNMDSKYESSQIDDYFEEEEDTDNVFDYVENNTGNNATKNFILQGCEINLNLNDKAFSDLDIVEQRQLKRCFIRMEILTKDNDRTIKYHMFKRFNAGGTILSSQELRNSNIRLLGDKFISFITELSNTDDYKDIISHMKPTVLQSMGDKEFILRYFATKNYLDEYDNYSHSEWLTKYLELVTEEKVSFDYENEKKDFLELVSYIKTRFGNKIFGGTYKLHDNVKKNLILYNYDGFMLYFSDKSNRLDSISYDDIHKIKKSELYLKFRTGGSANIQNRVGVIGEFLNAS